MTTATRTDLVRMLRAAGYAVRGLRTRRRVCVATVAPDGMLVLCAQLARVLVADCNGVTPRESAARACGFVEAMRAARHEIDGGSDMVYWPDIPYEGET